MGETNQSIGPPTSASTGSSTGHRSSCLSIGNSARDTLRAAKQTEQHKTKQSKTCIVSSKRGVTDNKEAIGTGAGARCGIRDHQARRAAVLGAVQPIDTPPAAGSTSHQSQRLRFWHCLQPAPHEEHVLPVRNVPCRHAEQTPVVSLHKLQLALQPDKSRQKDRQQPAADSRQCEMVRTCAEKNGKGNAKGRTSVQKPLATDLCRGSKASKHKANCIAGRCIGWSSCSNSRGKLSQSQNSETSETVSNGLGTYRPGRQATRRRARRRAKAEGHAEGQAERQEEGQAEGQAEGIAERHAERQ